MNIQHFEKGLSYTAEELIIVARKLGKLATYCNRLQNEDSAIRIEAERRATKKQRDMVKVMITVILPRRQLRAESRRMSAIDGVDRCIEKLEPQLKRYKEMHTGRDRAHRKRRRVGR
ncbi:MAG: hypothetical protein Greene041619_653 [Candidatus Peregrinibacteria bacterium Greene0416_19]|nr:MAG: hypothetical protein Greene041619_653 [Candidatus Peregrinibacteria bacterium Greene0416_19]